MGKKPPLIHTPIATKRGSINERLEKIESALEQIATSLPKMIAAGCLASGQKVYREVYDDLAGEHGRVFAVQEQAFMAVAESLHARLCVLESQSGVASPDLQQLRDLVNAIGEHGDVGQPGDANNPVQVLSRDEQEDSVRAFAEAHGGGLSKTTYPEWGGGGQPAEPINDQHEDFPVRE